MPNRSDTLPRLGPVAQTLLKQGCLKEGVLQSLPLPADEIIHGETLIETGLISRAELMECMARALKDEIDHYEGQDAQSATAIELKNVRKHLDGRTVLDGVNLEIPEGKITAIIGVSGGGKSVTLKHMIGLMRPDSGEVLVGNQPIHKLSGKALRKTRGRFGMLFQGGALFDSHNVFDNVAFPLREHGVLDEAAITERVEQYLAEVHLQGMGDKFPDELSGGMLKRAALARALALEPEIILLDEPTAGLDPIIENAIHHLIAYTFIQHRYTMVFISHAVPEIFNWCHHVVVLHDGKVLEAGPASQVRASQHPVIRQFVQGDLEGPIKVI
uniref:Putative ABC-type dipeptide/oligopeptide/nickel transporter, ATPase component n=1 Tax=Magnetococcus massalia (strain MO-1) TaxID=451514 RepID=A0A1S7LJE6_MAGMO|nr:putative ABC-type dipeptide/oligopeptide/nickel transporter, ATPase component [Candidatus Magnetococcus massalia]